MPIRLGPAGVPLSCKGRTIVEGMDDIISLGMDTMEIQTVRMVAPNHFEQYWQAGVLSHKAEFELNIHGPYYAELLGNRMQRNRSLAKFEASLQAGKVLNARHITCHVGPYCGLQKGREANEQAANVFAGIVERSAQLWEDEEEHPVFPWLENGTPTKVGIETSGRQNLWGSLEDVLEVVNHVEGAVPVINFAHIHARGHGRLKTSEDYGELFDLVRETIGATEFYCHFSGIEHRMGNALHYTQIKKSDLNFDPLAEFLVEEGEWLDVTLISDSPLLEHDAMYMNQLISKSKHRQLERKAREQRRHELAAKAGMTPDELEAREKAEAEKRRAAELAGDGEEAEDTLESKTVAQLKEICRELELPVSGTKSKLIERLEQDVKDRAAAADKLMRETLEGRTVPQLKDVCKKNNLIVSGNKTQIIDRIAEAGVVIKPTPEEIEAAAKEQAEEEDDLFASDEDDDLF